MPRRNVMGRHTTFERKGEGARRLQTLYPALLTLVLLFVGSPNRQGR